MTWTPLWARRVDTVLPAGPPPTTTTSAVCVAMFRLRGSGKGLPPGAVGIFVGQPGSAQEGDECFEVLVVQVAELPGVAVADRLPQVVQQLDAGGGDTDADDPAVVGRAVADD